MKYFYRKTRKSGYDIVFNSCLTLDQYTVLLNDQIVLSLELFGILTPLGLLDCKKKCTYIQAICFRRYYYSRVKLPIYLKLLTRLAILQGVQTFYG